MSGATCSPAAIVTEPRTSATPGSLLVTVTAVSAATGAVSSRSATVRCAAALRVSRPAEGGVRSATPTRAARIAGTRPGGGVPTNTVTWRTSLPIRSVSVASPAAPVTRVSGATCSPAAIVTEPRTSATPGSLLVTVTAVSAVTGAVSSRSATVRCAAALRVSRPAEGGVRSAMPIAGATTARSCSATGSFTETMAAGAPLLELVRIVVLPVATPVTGTKASVAPASSTTCPGTLAIVGSAAVRSTATSEPTGLDSERRRLVEPPTGIPTSRGCRSSPTTTSTVTRSCATALPTPSRPVATIVSVEASAAAGVVNAAMNGVPVTAGSASPFTSNPTSTMPSEGLPRASSTISLFSTTVAPSEGLVMTKPPVAKPKRSGVVSGLPSASTRALPTSSVTSAVRSIVTSASKGNSASGVNTTIWLPPKRSKWPAIGAPSACTTNEVAETDTGSIGSLNVTCRLVAIEMSTAPSGGKTLVTCGGVASEVTVIVTESLAVWPRLSLATASTTTSRVPGSEGSE